MDQPALSKLLDFVSVTNSFAATRYASDWLCSKYLCSMQNKLCEWLRIENAARLESNLESNMHAQITTSSAPSSHNRIACKKEKIC